MKRSLLFVIFLLLIGAAVGILLAECQGQTMQREPTARVFSSRIGGDWLKVERFNLADDPDAFHPCYTQIRCAYKPIVTRQADGTFLIQFVSDIGLATGRVRPTGGHAGGVDVIP